MSEPETVYCDDYDEIANNIISSTVEAKVVQAPEQPGPVTSGAEVETKAVEQPEADTDPGVEQPQQ